MRPMTHFLGLATVLAVIAPANVPAQELGYDPAADPFVQVSAASAEAAENGKLILIVAGGDWCIWCHYLERFLVDNPDIATPLKETFVVVKAYLGDENMNDSFFATLPEAVGYPHFWILAADGSVLESQNTLPLEDGEKSYDGSKFLAFIDRWHSAI